jgi:enoyl-CoA hydratase/carnithine racemase
MVVTFESAHPDFFLAHHGSTGQKSRFGMPRWIEAARRIAESSVLSIAVIRGRVRGGGCAFAMGLDVNDAINAQAANPRTAYRSRTGGRRHSRHLPPRGVGSHH